MFLPSMAKAEKTSINGKMNIALIGVGGIGSLTISTLKKCPEARISALCDVDDTRIAGGAKEYPNAPKFRDFRRMLDKMGKEDILAREEEELSEAARQLSALQGETASDAVADYLLRKRVIVDYEASVAGVLGLDAARDSLKGVAAQLKAIDYRLPRVDVAERYFLDYDSVAFSSTPKYSYQHPIPECKVYANGTIYRILLGTYNTKRAAATFRGAYPLFYLVNDAGKWCYYTGGFATLDEAEAAQALLKKRGFVRPEIVVWTDGAYRNLSLEPDSQKLLYRVEITGTDALSDEVKQVIAAAAGGYELSRVGQQLFIDGSFDDRAVADRLADAIRQTDAALEIKVAEIAE